MFYFLSHFLFPPPSFLSSFLPPFVPSLISLLFPSPSLASRSPSLDSATAIQFSLTFASSSPLRLLSSSPPRLFSSSPLLLLASSPPRLLSSPSRLLSSSPPLLAFSPLRLFTSLLPSAGAVNDVVEWTVSYVENHLNDWITDHGGWEGFYNFYQNQDQVDGGWLNPRRVLGYAAGLVGVLTIGAFLGQRA